MDTQTQMESGPRSLHTPGPWTLFHDRIAAPCHDHPHCEKTIAWLGWGEQPLKCTHDGYGKINNARLIAAAPELLLAIKSLLNCIDETRGMNADSAVREAERVVAKVEGTPSVPELPKSENVTGVS